MIKIRKLYQTCQILVNGGNITYVTTGADSGPHSTRLPSDTRTGGLQLVLLHQRIGSKLNQSSIVVVSFQLQVEKNN